MLFQGRIPVTEAEDQAIEKLLARHDGNATLTRRDPGDTGPILVHIDDDTWQINEDGKARKLAKADR